ERSGGRNSKTKGKSQKAKRKNEEPLTWRILSQRDDEQSRPQHLLLRRSRPADLSHQVRVDLAYLIACAFKAPRAIDQIIGAPALLLRRHLGGDRSEERRVGKSG